MFQLLTTLKENYEVEITEMQHGYRINGVIDVYKKGGTVYDIVEVRYDKIKDYEKKLLWCIDKIKKHPKQEAFKNKNKHGISYQQFKNNKFKDKTDLDKFCAEDYHWKKFADKHEGDDLYFLFHNETVKIGRSNDPASRIYTLSTSLSHSYTCYVFKGKGFMESILHRCFEDFNTKREWFKDNERFRRFITRYHTGALCYKF